GNLFSIDLPKFYEGQSEIYLTEEGRPEHTGFVPKGKEPGWLIPPEIRGRWKLTLGDSKEELPKLLKELGKVDIFYHDSDHSYQAMMNEFETVWSFIPEGGVLLSDDVKGNNAFQDFVKKIKPRFHHIYEGLGIILK
ncbi:MAG: class I SAM-dependent methyltransferase, partial [Candidatus Taylorbacteria bacterium]|nr:class I SAM-dependent methyltransferase [Candidatus Taylorbacteria bacterium]